MNNILEQKQLVNFRFGDSDLSAYLLMIGYKPTSIEIIKDKRHNNRIKAFVHFEGLQEDFIHIRNQYTNGEFTINLQEFSKSRQQINKLIKKEIDNYLNNNN